VLVVAKRACDAAGGGSTGGDAVGDACDPMRTGTLAPSFDLVSVAWVQKPAGDS
jgi:hypothetical protein